MNFYMQPVTHAYADIALKSTNWADAIEEVKATINYTTATQTPTETPRISTETAETVNVSAKSENAAETKEMPQIFNCEWQTVEHFKAIPNIAKLANAKIIINGVGYHTEYLDQAHNVLARVDNLGWDMKMHAFPYQGSGVFGKTELFENWEDAVIATIDALTDYLHTRGIEPPQSPEAPQTVECTAKPCKLAQMA